MRSLKLFIDAKTGKRFYARTVKELRSKIGNGGSRVNRMYVDAKDGHTYHIGYVIGPYWLEMYEPVMRMMRNASDGFVRQCAEAWREHCRKAFTED